MPKWSARMPREKPPADTANVVLAYRLSNGLRMEIQAKLDAQDADALMCQAIEMMKKRKEQK